MDFSIETAALAAASGMSLTAIAFYYLSNLISKTPALKWWAISFTGITLDYIMVFFLPFDKFGVLIPLWEAVHATFVSGLLIGVLYFLNRKIPFVAIGVLWCIIVGWGVLSVIVKFGFFYQTIPATIIASGMVFYSGCILFSYKPVHQEPGYRFAGVAFILWGLNRLNFSVIEFIPWFIPFGYIIALLTAMAMGTGLIIAVLERQHHRVILSEAEVIKTTQKVKKELEQRVKERTIELQQEISEHKQTEDSLKGSEAQFRKMIKKSPLPMVITDSNQNNSFYNDKFIETYGYTLDDISTTEKWWIKVYPDAEYRAKVQHSWKVAIEKAKANKTDIEMQEWDITIKDGTKKKCEFYMVPLDDFSLIIMNDVTASKRDENALRKSEEKFRRIFDNLQDGYLWADSDG
ncbi:MAG: PAS domain S-box protein, partial [Desulfobacula sp.]|nr:PAS domain S-box protein [Desulfobacula sp.]